MSGISIRAVGLAVQKAFVEPLATGCFSNNSCGAPPASEADLCRLLDVRQGRRPEVPFFIWVLALNYSRASQSLTEARNLIPDI